MFCFISKQLLPALENGNHYQPFAKPHIAARDVWSDMPGISQPARHEMLYLDSLERAQRLKVRILMVFGPRIWEHWEIRIKDGGGMRLPMFVVVTLKRSLQLLGMSTEG